jgi:hypothetical protein
MLPAQTNDPAFAHGFPKMLQGRERPHPIAAGCRTPFDFKRKQCPVLLEEQVDLPAVLVAIVIPANLCLNSNIDGDRPLVNYQENLNSADADNPGGILVVAQRAPPLYSASRRQL